MLAGNGYYKLENDDESTKPFLDSNKSDLDSLSEEPPSASTHKLSRRQKVFLTCFVAASLLVGIVVSVILTQKTSLLDRVARISTDRKFSLDDIFSGKFSYQSYAADWVSDESYIHIGDNGVVKYSMDPIDTTVIMSPAEKSESSVYDGSFKELSPDKQWFLFTNNTKSLYRHSFYGDYYLKNLTSGKIKKLMTPKGDSEQIRYCGWSTVGNALVFVHKCNIYYVPNADQANYYQITKNGIPKKVFNGVPDWVYEEEIISSTHAIEFSTDGRYMSYVMFNATLVPFYRFPKYGPPENMYPTIEKIAYPKAGFPNPTINITIVDLDKVGKNAKKSETVKMVNVPRNHLIPPIDITKLGDYYYAVMKFNKKDQVFVQWMNRAQNKTISMMYEMADSNGFIVEQHETPNGWIDDDYVRPKFAKDGSFYITMLPSPVPGKGEFRHLAKVTINDQMVGIEYLTSGPFTVQDIKCYNDVDQVVYFRSTEMSTRYRHVYSYNIKTKEKICVSCGLIKDTDGTNCTYYYPSFSKSCSWVILLCQGPFVPKSDLYGLKSKKRVILTTNDNARKALEAKDVPVNVHYTIKSDGYDIPVKETRPKSFDSSKRYAVLFDVYGGPNTQKVRDVYKLEFDSFFVSMHDIILVEFDARGTGYYGYNFLYAVYRRLGLYESKDAIAVAKYLQEKPYVDGSKIAIWGWSYGGFYSASTLAMSDGVINTAVAVAPVTDWRYYDTVYSERYMGFPSKEDNLEGYEETAIMSKAKKFAGKNFLLIHGTADDNVHFQNSAQLAAALISAKVNFRSQFYTDRRHGIQSRGHIYYVIANYILKHLKGKGLPGERFGFDDDNT